jgi:hypothetical protein
MEADKDTTERGDMKTIPMVTSDCVLAVADKAMRTDMPVFGTEVLEELIEDQPHLMRMITFMLTEIIAKDKDEETAAMDAVQTMCCIGVVFKAIKAQVEANEMASLFSEEEGEVA